MKKRNVLLAIAVVAAMFTGCKKKSDNVTPTTPSIPASYVTGKSLTGALKGTLMKDSTYHLTGNVTINKGDTLTIQPGVTVKADGNFSFMVSGNFICIGTNDKPIMLTTNFASPVISNGYWGGIQADSNALNINIQYTHINWTGGPAADLSTQACIDVEGTQATNYGAKIVIENNWFFGSIDDGIHLAGQITVSVKRNVLQHMGGPDGETMNIKKGVMGDIAFNYIWSAANNGIKLETGSLLPQTKMNIFNNTIINCGWRKVGEPTNGILIDKNTAANIVNNLIVGCRAGINITAKADTNNCKYGNNLVYAIDDSLKSNVFVYLKATSSDITGSGVAACTSVFAKYDATVDLTDPIFKDNNNPTLASSSPAKGKGTSSLPANSKVATYFTVGTADALNTDIGAYTSDGKGNSHLPTTNQ